MIYLNGILVTFSKYPNGETMVPNLHAVSKAHNVVKMLYENDFDLFSLVLLRPQLGNNCRLILPYLPYSRMDRSMPGEMHFSLKTVCALINSLNFCSVEVCNPHSDVGPALLDRCTSYNTLPFMAKVVASMDCISYVYFADGSAAKRYEGSMKGLKPLYGIKHRDFETGKISNVMVVNLPKERLDEDVIIVDDLCSRGGTFIPAIQPLKTVFNKVHLCVAHLETTVHEGKILDYVDTIYTTDSIYRGPHHEKIKIMEVYAK